MNTDTKNLQKDTRKPNRGTNKRIIHHDKARVTPRMQSCFNIPKISVIQYINKEQKHTTISTYADENPMFSLVNSQQTENRTGIPEPDSKIHENPTTTQGCLFSSLFFCIVLDVLQGN